MADIGREHHERLILSFDPALGSFAGTVEDTTTQTICTVMIEVYLSTETELSSTEQTDLLLGEKAAVQSPAAERISRVGMHTQRLRCVTADEVDHVIRNRAMSRRTSCWLVSLMVLLLAGVLDFDTVLGQEPPPDIALSLDHNPIETINSAIAGAQHTILAVVFKFNEPTVLDAVREALARGVTVRLLVDSVDAERSKSLVRDAEQLGAQVRRWGSGEMHAKFTIVDDSWVITGSFNWTQSAATSNVELIAGVGDAAVVARFVELFQDLWDRAGHPGS